MVAIALVIFTAAIIYVMIWSMKNEDARSIGDQTGLIKMRDPTSSAGKSSDPRGRAAHLQTEEKCRSAIRR